MKLLAMTVLCIDKYPELNLECVGGNSVNIAARWKKLGEKDVSVLGAVGNDALGDKVIDFLVTSRIEMSHVYRCEGETAHNHFYKSTESELFREEGWTGGVYEKFFLSEDDWRFVSEFDLIAIPYFNPNFDETVKRFSGKKKIAVDFLNTRDIELIKRTLPKADLVFISGTKEMASSLTDISKQNNIPVIITLGAEGSMALINGELYFQNPERVENKLDSIGCGDSFQAAFIQTWYKDKDVQKAMKAGASAAAEILQKYGGV